MYQYKRAKNQKSITIYAPLEMGTPCSYSNVCSELVPVTEASNTSQPAHFFCISKYRTNLDLTLIL